MTRRTLRFYLAVLPVVVFPVRPEMFEQPKAWLLLATAYALTFSGASTRSPLAWCGVAWIAACAVSLVGAPNPAVGIFGAHHSYDGLLQQAAYLVLFVAATRLEPGELVGPVCLGATLAAAYVLVQAVGLDPVVWRNEAGFGGYVRPFGTLGHPNHAGAVMAMALPFALSSRAWWRWLVVGVLVLACVVTISRAAWAAMAAGAGAWWLASRR